MGAPSPIISPSAAAILVTSKLVRRCGGMVAERDEVAHNASVVASRDAVAKSDFDGTPTPGSYRESVALLGTKELTVRHGSLAETTPATVILPRLVYMLPTPN